MLPSLRRLGVSIALEGIVRLTRVGDAEWLGGIGV
jgi:hypothetical protein